MPVTLRKMVYSAFDPPLGMRAKNVDHDTWFTVQLRETSSGEIYRQAIKVAAGENAGEATVMLYTGHEYEIVDVSEQSDWRYETVCATYPNSDEDTWSAADSGISYALFGDTLPATLELAHTLTSTNARKLNIAVVYADSQWESDSTSLVNTMQ